MALSICNRKLISIFHERQNKFKGLQHYRATEIIVQKKLLIFQLAEQQQKMKQLGTANSQDSLKYRQINANICYSSLSSSKTKQNKTFLSVHAYDVLCIPWINFR